MSGATAAPANAPAAPETAASPTPWRLFASRAQPSSTRAEPAHLGAEKAATRSRSARSERRRLGAGRPEAARSPAGRSRRAGCRAVSGALRVALPALRPLRQDVEQLPVVGPSDAQQPRGGEQQRRAEEEGGASGVGQRRGRAGAHGGVVVGADDKKNIIPNDAIVYQCTIHNN